MHDTVSDELVFHLALPTDWAEAFATGEYRMSTRGQTLDEVGFIHCSAPHQLEATANRFYGDLAQLVLVAVDPARLHSPLVFEPPAPDVDELFPHVYGPIPLAAVDHTKPWQRRDGHPWSLADL